MRVVHNCYGLVFTVLAAFSGVATGQPEPVDQFGDFSKLIVHGGRPFDAEQIRKKLSGDFVSVVAAHPRAPLDKLPQVVQDRLLEGFQHAGYADACVEVRINRSLHCLEATIDEGDLYTCHDLRIEGAVSIPVSELIDRLTQRCVPNEFASPVFCGPIGGHHVKWRGERGSLVGEQPPIWSRGKPAPMSHGMLRKLRNDVQNALTDVGFPDSRFDVQRIMDRDNKTVDLVVRIQDEGPAMIIREIEITGATRNSHEAIVDYLNLQTGTLLTCFLQRRLEFELWRSGRFSSFKIEPVLPTLWQTATKLRIELVESPYAPPLDEPLTREQQVMLRVRDWLANESQWPEDLHLTVSETARLTELVIAPSQGALMSLAPRESPTKVSFLLNMTPETFTITLPQQLNAFETKMPAKQTCGMLVFRLKSDTTASGRPFETLWQFAQLPKGSYANAPPFHLELSVCPAAAIAWPALPQARCDWDGDLLTITSDSRNIVVDANTGRLIQLRLTSDGASLEVCFRDNAYAEAASRLSDARNAFPNAYQADRPVTSLLSVLNEEEFVRAMQEMAARAQPGLLDKPLNVEQPRLLRRLIELGVFAPLDAFVVAMNSADQEDHFIIQQDIRSLNGFVAFAALGLPLADEIFPRETWPWIVWRETALVAAGYDKYTNEEIRRIFYSNDSGPICHLVIAGLLKRGKPGLSLLFAERGLTLTDVEFFRYDYAPLLDGNCLAGRCLLRAAEILRELERDEVEELTKTLPEVWRTSIRTLAAELRKGRGQPIDTALPAALDASWENGWSTLAAETLRQMSSQTP